MLRTSYREIAGARLPEFLDRQYKQRHFIPHDSYFLPKCGPDGLKMARRMCGIGDPSKLWEVVLYAHSPLIDEFPADLFFDDDLVWHQQQFGKVGHIAFADLVVKGRVAYGMNYISDLVQRISRRREHKTRVDNRFKGWTHMLLNAILSFALERKLRKVYSATADLTLRHTDPKRSVKRALFDRIYDRTVTEHWRARRKGDWWLIDVAENADRVVVPERKWATLHPGKTICVCHDIERGHGHIGTDAALAKSAEQMADQHLDEMLRIEQAAGVTATYNVLGCLFGQVRDRIEDAGHCIAFHSYDHAIGRPLRLQGRYQRIAARALRWAGGVRLQASQLDRLREIDYRVKGYRPPRSLITPDISDERLCYHNFEWLASSAYSLGIRRPVMRNRLARIPIAFDDFDLYRRAGTLTYKEWEQGALSALERSDFVAFGLHDCYAQYWLPQYERFLREVRGLGILRTLDQVAGVTTLASAV
ncbi:MAG: hypothetical protein PVH41_11445 [Anaerolineae bacterium]